MGENVDVKSHFKHSEEFCYGSNNFSEESVSQKVVVVDLVSRVVRLKCSYGLAYNHFLGELIALDRLSPLTAFS